MSGYDDGPRWPERDLRGRDRERDRERDQERDQGREPEAPDPRAPEPPAYSTWTPRPREPEPQQPEPQQPEPQQPEPQQPEEQEQQPEPPQEPAPPPQEPQRDLPTPATESAPPTTSLGDAGPPGSDGGDGGGDDGGDGGDDDDGSGDSGDPGDDRRAWDARRQGDRRKPTTAEQAVPWLIGLLLALTGIVVVLLALIFVGPEGVAVQPTPTPTPLPTQPRQSTRPFATATPAPTELPTSTPPPTFGALEMVYLGRSTANSPIRLSRRDFSTTAEPAVIAEDANGVGDYTWAPDGRVGAAIIGGAAVALEAGQPPRPLIDAIDALAFADDSTTLYGLRIISAGANDRAEVLTIQFETGATEILTSITYPHPDIFPDPPLKEAQFADNGGIVRLYATIDGHVVAWILGAPATYRIDPADGTYVDAGRQPVLWSPDQRSRIDVTLAGSVTTLTLRDRAEAVTATVTVTGLVSHIRWAATNNEIVFTLGRTVGGGVRQDLYVWDLVDGKAPAALTSNGASFGAEWLGVLQSWLP